MSSLIRWRAAYPMAATWLFSRLLYSLAFSFVLCYSNSVENIRFFSTGRLTAWALQHGVLATSLGAGFSILTWLFLMKLIRTSLLLLSPSLEHPEMWSAADREAREAIGRRVRSVRISRFLAICVAAGVILIVVLWCLPASLTPRWTPLHSGLWVWLAFLLPIQLFLDLRQNGPIKTDPGRSVGVAA